MRFHYLPSRPQEPSTDAVIVPVGSVGDDLDLSLLLEAVGGGIGAEIASFAVSARFKGKLDSTLYIPMFERPDLNAVILTGMGPRETFKGDHFVRAIGAAARVAWDRGAVNVVVNLPGPGWELDPSLAIELGAIGARLGLYAFLKYRGKGAPDRRRTEIEHITFIARDVPAKDAERALTRARAIADAVILARDLGNEPASTLTPEALAVRARELAFASSLEVEILGPDELMALGANAMIAVGSGSFNAPQMIRLRYAPETSPLETRTVGLVGKAITFDTGGYSIKPYEGMLEMKGDMLGGAAVLGAMSALKALACPIPVLATICAAENMISGTAFRPGDVIEGMNGVTMEILSTDAEGRLVLADGLVDTARRGATELIDLATLTGAAVVALGEGATALFSTDDALANGLLAAADASGERMWRLPLFDELEQKIKGDVADIKNTGGRGGGAITAALFLRHFSEGLPWAHLDIAGAARQEKPSAIGSKGATGVGVRTLLRYLTS